MKRILFTILAAGVLLAAVSQATMPRVKQEPGRTFWGAVADTTNATTPKPGEVYTDTATNRKYIYTGTAWVPARIRYVSPIDTLTAPGNFLPVETLGYTHATIVFGDSLVATSATIQFRGLTSGVAPLSWYTLDAENDTTVCVGTSGTWARTFTLAGGIDWIRLKVVSEAGSVSGLFKSVIILWDQYK